MSVYAERPWLKHYPASVPHTLEPYPAQTVHAFLESAAARAPQSTALVTSARLPSLLGRLGRLTNATTYGDLNRASDALAAALVDMGLEKGDRVAIVMPNSVQFVVAFYGILKAGGVVAATNPTFPADKLADQLNDCGARFILCLSMFYNLVRQVKARTAVERVIVANIKEYLPPLARTLFTIAREKKDGHRVEALDAGDEWLQDILTRYSGQKASVSITPSDDALFQYTGGTTGVSKAAVSTHSAIVANTVQCIAFLTGGLGESNSTQHSFLGAIPLFHVFGMIAVLSFAVGMGVPIFLVPNARDINDVLDTIDSLKPTLFQGVPALYNAINAHPRVKAGEVDLRSIQVCVSGSAPLPPATKREFERITGGRLLEGYGMSEAPTATHCNPVRGEDRIGSIGIPLPDIKCRIVSIDDRTQELPVGEVGEIVIGGPTLMRGYHNMPAESAHALFDHDGEPWFLTGDLGYMDADGYFYIVDRKKDMAILGGFNVYPNTIEKCLADHPAVAEVGVAAIPHPEKVGQETLKAWVVRRPGMNVTEQELIDFASSKLAGYEVPRRFAFIDELPKTAVGKTLRRELVRMEQEASTRV